MYINIYLIFVLNIRGGASGQAVSNTENELASQVQTLDRDNLYSLTLTPLEIE